MQQYVKYRNLSYPCNVVLLLKKKRKRFITSHGIQGNRLLPSAHRLGRPRQLDARLSCAVGRNVHRAEVDKATWGESEQTCFRNHLFSMFEPLFSRTEIRMRIQLPSFLLVSVFHSTVSPILLRPFSGNSSIRRREIEKSVAAGRGPPQCAGQHSWKQKHGVYYIVRGCIFQCHLKD